MSSAPPNVLLAFVFGLALALLATGCGAKGGQPPPSLPGEPLPPPKVTAGELDARVLLADLPRRASGLGAGGLSVVASGEILDGERLGAFVEVPRDVCLLGYARGSTSLEDLDIAVFSEEGTPLAIDEAPDAHPTILLCPPHPDRVYMVARAENGGGLVAVAAQLVPREKAAGVAKALGARGSVADGPRPAEAWPGLDEAVRAHRAALGGTWEDFRKVALPVDARVPTFLQLPLDADRCTDVLVVPDDQVALLEVEALDAEGRVIARARDGGRVRSLTVCSPFQVAGTLAIRPHGGRGLAAVVLARARGDVARDLSGRPDVAWTATTLPLEATKADRNAELQKRGYEPPTQTTTGSLVLGRRATVDVRPVQGCARIDVVTGAPLALIEASAWDDAGGLLSKAEGATSATLFACSPGAKHVELETRGRPGPFAVLVRPERWKDPAFTAHPLASARMLARAAEGPSSQLEGTAHSVRASTLDSTKAMRWSETIPAGKCLRVAAGAQGEGTGLELRISDATNDVELDRSHAANAVGVRACAPSEGGRAVKLDLRATSGKLDVVVGERISG